MSQTVTAYDRSIRKFLKTLGVKAHQEIAAALSQSPRTSSSPPAGGYKIKARITVDQLDLTIDLGGEIVKE